MWEEKQIPNEKMKIQFFSTRWALSSGQYFLPGLILTFPGQRVGDTRNSRGYLRLYKQDGNCGHQPASQSLDLFYLFIIYLIGG